MSDDERKRAIVVFASMGADDDSAAHEMRRRLEAQGYDVQLREHLKTVWPCGWIVRASCGTTFNRLAGGPDLGLKWLDNDRLLAPGRGGARTTRSLLGRRGIHRAGHARGQGDAPLIAELDALDRAATANGLTSQPVTELVDERR